MPADKNRVIRLHILDELLSDTHKYYTISKLVEIVNYKLKEESYLEVTRRTIEKDLKVLEDAPFFADIEYYYIEGSKKRYVRYRDKSSIIFNSQYSKLTEEEKKLLKEAFSLIGQIDGLPDLDGLNDLKNGLKVKDDRTIIAFTENPLRGTKLVGEIYTAISKKIVIELLYKSFKKTKTVQSYYIFPYLLKQYRGRWYLVATRIEDEEIRIFPLDRMNSIKLHPEIQYKDYDGDVNEIFDDIIGVTYYPSEPVKKILFWVSDDSVLYVDSKPLHGSQVFIKGKEADELVKKYPQLEGGGFFSLSCKRNYELIHELCSFGRDLIVLEPKEIRDEIMRTINEMITRYSLVSDKP